MPLSTISSFVLWLSLYWWVISAAISVTIRGDFSSSPLAFGIELLCAAATIFTYLQTQILRRGGWVRMLKLRKWRVVGQAIGAGALVFVGAWMVVFLVNVRGVYREMISSPPSINIELIQQRYAMVVQPGMGKIAENYFFDRFQYELNITNQSKKLDIVPLDLRFQFPYNVESSEIKSKDTDEDTVIFIPEEAKQSFSGNGTFEWIGPPPTWKNYLLHVSKLSPNGKIAIIFRLNGKLDPRAKTHDPKGPFILPRDQSLYVAGAVSFSMGEHVIKRTYYAPMFLDDNARTLSIGFGEDHIPSDAEWEFQTGP